MFRIVHICSSSSRVAVVVNMLLTYARDVATLFSGRRRLNTIEKVTGIVKVVKVRK